MTAYDCAHFGGGAEGGDYGVDVFGFDGVHYPVTGTGDEMAVLKDCDIFLLTFFSGSYLRKAILHEVARTLLANSAWRASYFSGTSQACTLRCG